jgi:uncharacterized protein YjbI with pentapeptide repeats
MSYYKIENLEQYRRATDVVKDLDKSTEERDMNSLLTFLRLGKIEQFNKEREKFKVLNFVKIDLSYSDLTKANLSNAYLSYAKLSYANLFDAKLSNARLPYANLSNAKLFDAKLSNAILPYANLPYADLSNANLSNANLSNAKFINITNCLLSEEELKKRGAITE